MTESDYLEFRFIQIELKRFGMELREVMVRQITDKDIISMQNIDQHLRDRINFKVSREGEKGGKIQFVFPSHGRFVEIMYRKNKSRAKLASRATTIESLYGIKTRAKSTKRKDTQWYNQTAFGNIYNLVGRLSYGYTEAVRLDLKQRLIDPFRK